MTKRILFVLVAVAALALLVPTMALANYAIHGNYLTDTDACAGCHRAHTSVSTIEWTDKLGTSHNALLTTTATNMKDFCYACHDATSQGADTNVQDGVYEGDLYGPSGVMAPLNGGGFEKFQGESITSMHDSESGEWGAYGGGYWGDADAGADGEDPNAALGETAPIVMDCATCHDPHGSANYRILKASVFGNTVGGYLDNPSDPADPTPDGWVQSTEEGWPIGGFRLHQAYPNYKPNYIQARYAKGYNMAAGDTPNEDKGMTGWCSGCHATYNNKSTTYGGNPDGGFSSVYNAGDGFGLTTRHRHPVNVPLSAFDGPESLVPTDTLPLAHDLDLTEAGNTGGNTDSDWIECLTCHRAHGTSAVMTGWASNEGAAAVGHPFVSPGINSQSPSALLRLNNRGVCEVCHNK